MLYNERRTRIRVHWNRAHMTIRDIRPDSISHKINQSNETWPQALLNFTHSSLNNRIPKGTTRAPPWEGERNTMVTPRDGLEPRSFERGIDDEVGAKTASPKEGTVQRPVVGDDQVSGLGRGGVVNRTTCLWKLKPRQPRHSHTAFTILGGGPCQFWI